jgi:hypothetical protein
VHLVAAFEVRGSFPLDSVCQGDVLPSNCKEIVYPGVHSDVGGGYPPNDQGRALGKIEVSVKDNTVQHTGDRKKLSQIALAQMYREARMAGVPLVPESAMIGARKANFAIDPQLIKDFNAYIAATRNGSVPPTQGSGEPAFARMFPTETQPREELHRIIRRHAGILLRWRKSMLDHGGMASLPGLKQNPLKSRLQDMEDIRGAEEELKKEIAFLRDTDPQKYKIIDDTFFDKYLGYLDTAVVVPALIANAELAGLLTILSWGAKGTVADVMREKQKQWDTWLHAEWEDHSANALPKAAEVFFENYLHDSRAWFKALMRSDVKSMTPDDETWFTLGGFEDEKKTRIAAQQKIIDQPRKSGDTQALIAVDQAQKQLQTLQQDGQPLVIGGREPYRLWGYLRHRKIYQSGQLHDDQYASRQQAIESEEKGRVRQKRRTDRMAQENARHDTESKRIKDSANQALKSGRIKDQSRAEFIDGTRQQLESEKRFNTEALSRIEKETAVPVE